MKNKDYWDARIALEKEWAKQNIKNDEDYAKLVQSFFDKAARQMEDAINAEYIKYAGKHGLTIQEAKKAIDANDIKLYEARAKEIVEEARRIYKEKGSVTYADFSKQVNGELSIYNATMRKNRLEYLKARMGQEVTEVGLQLNKSISDRLTGEYLDELKRQAGILGRDLPADLTDGGKVFEQIQMQVASANFSDRIWANMEGLKDELSNQLTRFVIQGLGPAEIARKLKPFLHDKLANAQYLAERLARTESARIQWQAQYNSFKKYGYDYARWITAGESHVCDICLGISEHESDVPGEPGVYKLGNLPNFPVHANCRCTIVAFYK